MTTAVQNNRTGILERLGDHPSWPGSAVQNGHMGILECLGDHPSWPGGVPEGRGGGSNPQVNFLFEPEPPPASLLTMLRNIA